MSVLYQEYKYHILDWNADNRKWQVWRLRDDINKAHATLEHDKKVYSQLIFLLIESTDYTTLDIIPPYNDLL